MVSPNPSVTRVEYSGWRYVSCRLSSATTVVIAEKVGELESSGRLMHVIQGEVMGPAAWLSG